MDELPKAYKDAAMLVQLFARRRGFELLGKPEDFPFQRNFTFGSGRETCIVSIYNTGAIFIGGDKNQLRRDFEEFRSVVGGKTAVRVKKSRAAKTNGA
jgi:hypothetical protein